MSARIPQIPVVFGMGRLDSLDRQILEVICKHGREGRSFNRLVSEVEPYASRSTFALRAKRLEKLRYIERFPDSKNRQMVRIRGTPMTLLVTRIASRMKLQCAELERAIRSQAESAKGQKAFGEDEIDRQMEFASHANNKVKGIFSLIGVYAVNFGENVAGDFLLPMVMEDFRKLNSALLSLLASNPKLTRAMADRKLSGIPLASVEDDFKYAFGTEIGKVLPKYSMHLRRLSKLPRPKGDSG